MNASRRFLCSATVIAMALGHLSPVLHAADPVTITIQAGEQDRLGTVVRFSLGDAWKNKTLVAQDATQTPVQVDAEGVATLLLSPALPKGKSMTLQLRASTDAQPPPASVEAVVADTSLNLVAHARASVAPKVNALIATYQMQPGPLPPGTAESFAHGAHLHPVYSPSGKLLTANHPPDHPHQRGIWMSWTKTEFGAGHPDFWNMGKDKSGKLTGEIRFDRLLTHWSGPVHGGFTSAHRWLDHTTGTERDVLQETWQLTVYHTLGLEESSGKASPSLYLLDLVSTQTVSGNEPLKLPKYHYGGLGVRGSALWDAVDEVTMLTSEGHDRKTGDATNAKWVWLGGLVEDAPTGITVLIHPDNFRFPQPLRLNPKNPQLCIAPSAAGDWSIEPGMPLVLRYRIVLSDGKPDPVELERLWIDYARPPQVEVK